MIRRTCAILALLGLCGAACLADEIPVSSSSDDSRDTTAEPAGVDWGNLLPQSLAFLTLEHGFRYATQYGTRHPHSSFFGGYVNSLNNLHGWADGDDFITNYVGHPMQGAVSGFLFVQNDRRYRTAVFGKNRAYWKSRLRAAAYAWAYSEQFEIGPLSEASIGNVAAFYPQTGFVDQVVTPSIGLGWIVAEDWLDRVVIERVEARVHNPYVRMLVRGGLNPSRSMANALGWNLPWHRETRTDVWTRQTVKMRKPRPDGPPDPSAIAPFEFMASSNVQQFFGRNARGTCVGGGGTAAVRMPSDWQLIGNVNGCKLLDLATNYSGDSLSYLIGPRWPVARRGRWEARAEVLAGGRTLTHEQIDPLKKAQVEAAVAKSGMPITYVQHAQFARDTEKTGFAFSTSVALDAKLTNALALHVADVGYTWTGNATLNGLSYSHAVQFSAGLTLRMGSW